MRKNWSSSWKFKHNLKNWNTTENLELNLKNWNKTWKLEYNLYEFGTILEMYLVEFRPSNGTQILRHIWSIILSNTMHSLDVTWCQVAFQFFKMHSNFSRWIPIFQVSQIKKFPGSCNLSSTDASSIPDWREPPLSASLCLYHCA